MVGDHGFSEDRVVVVGGRNVLGGYLGPYLYLQICENRLHVSSNNGVVRTEQ